MAQCSKQTTKCPSEWRLFGQTVQTITHLGFDTTWAFVAVNCRLIIVHTAISFK